MFTLDFSNPPHNNLHILCYWGGVTKYKLCGRPGREGYYFADQSGQRGEGELIDFVADVVYGWSLSHYLLLVMS